jgi:hypothetical protein
MGNPQRPQQKLHCTPMPGLVAGQVTNRKPWCRNTSELTRANQQVAHVSQKKALRWPQ